MEQHTIFVVFVFGIINSGKGYQYFQGLIPNGDQVPHPCKENYTWNGVGHRNPEGGGSRNQFGIDFLANGKKWNPTLCMKDSDKDGMSNGQELGDPSCVWRPGAQANRTSDLSHPGVCEPLDSEICLAQNQWEFCDSNEFKCPALDATKDVHTLTLRFNHTKVPAQKTNYYCQTFDIPTDQDYHIIASKPIINNTAVMHHSVIFGCLGGYGDDAGSMYNTASPCGMRPSDDRCTQMIIAWSLGFHGQCENERMGYRIGKTGYTKLVIQNHWNNPELRDDYYDSSGVLIYYTPNLRPYDGGMMIIGQTSLNIPPNMPLYTATSKMSKVCTNYITQDTGPLAIVGNYLHMHSLGKSIKLEQYTDGKMISSLGEVDVYHYDHPVRHIFETPVEIQSQDEVYLTCNYNSTGRNSTTIWGHGTSAEMCLAFIQYYPVSHHMLFILNQDSKDYCAVAVRDAGKLGVVEGCNLDDFIQTQLNSIIHKIENVCDVTGQSCYHNCYTYMKDLMKDNVCVRENNVIDMVESATSDYQNINAFWLGFKSCDKRIAANAATTMATTHWVKTTDDISMVRTVEGDTGETIIDDIADNNVATTVGQH
ncbi:unnamed protein product [Owenia fusiformis]|uniref:Uncharacterized protein n=1 Tax=Owenia fusiformis TaxID=6347 RepID=A0A8J1YAX7_OWEFU|nr:unnamed protein product [Owenia fusiformis]